MPIDIKALCERLAQIYGQCGTSKDDRFAEDFDSPGEMLVSLPSLRRMLWVFSDKPIRTEEFIDCFARVFRELNPNRKLSTVVFLNHSDDQPREEQRVIGRITNKGQFEKIDEDEGLMRIFSLEELAYETPHGSRQFVICRSGEDRWHALLIVSERGGAGSRKNIGLSYLMSETGNFTHDEFTEMAMDHYFSNVEWGHMIGDQCLFIDMTQNDLPPFAGEEVAAIAGEEE